jgi:hypothetical protein
MFGYHPHGVIPILSALLPHTSAWRAAVRGRRPAALTASITHITPIMRDLLQWGGGGCVSARGIEAALRRAGAVLFVPGGQLEMTYSRSAAAGQAVVTSHLGFLRLALQHGARARAPRSHLARCRRDADTSLSQARTSCPCGASARRASWTTCRARARCSCG